MLMRVGNCPKCAGLLLREGDKWRCSLCGHYYRSQEIEAIEQPLTRLQYHFLSRLHHLIDLRATYKSDPDFETWRMNAINKALYSTVKDLNLSSQ